MVKPRKDSNGTWIAQPMVTLANGVRKRAFIRGSSREEVTVKLKELYAQESRGLSCADNDLTVGEYLDYWLNTVLHQQVRNSKLKESTLSGYKNMVNKHLKPALGGYILKELNVENVDQGLDTIIENGYAGSVACKCRQVLVTCLKRAMKERKVMFNAASLVDKPAYKPKERVVWSADMAALFLESVKDHQQYIAFLLVMTYGMRRGEVLGLRWCDIDFINGDIHVRQQIYRLNSALKADSLKTDSSFRILPLDPEIHIALIEHAKKNNIDIPPFEPKFQLSLHGTVVRSKADTPIEPRNFLRCFQNLVKKLGLPHLTVHDKRHIAATNFKDSGIPVLDAAKLLGHAKPETTLRIYQHGTSETQRTGISIALSRLSSKATAPLTKPAKCIGN